MVRYESYAPYSIHSYAIRVLKKEKRSMTVDELYAKILKYRQFYSKRPKNSLVSVLLRSSYIIRVGTGRYKLK